MFKTYWEENFSIPRLRWKQKTFSKLVVKWAGSIPIGGAAPSRTQCVTLSSNMLYTLYSEHWGWLLCCVSSHLSSATTMWLTGRNFHPTCLLVSRLRGKNCSLAAKLSLRVLVRTSRKASKRRTSKGDAAAATPAAARLVRTHSHGIITRLEVGVWFMSVRWLDISGNRRRGTADSAEPCELSLASGEAKRLLGAIGKE